jgi:UDPglucose 6-dehydrogenase
VITNIETAEMIKYASNAFLATKVSFINEIANICEKVGADVNVVAKGMGLDQRIGSKFLHAGPGYGGSCFPKDTLGIAKIAEKHGYRFEIIRSVMKVNEKQKERMVAKAKEALGNLKGKTITVLGLSFKPNTDDIREAPSIKIISSLQKEGARVKAYDPKAMAEAQKIFKKIEYGRDAYEAAKGADALLIITEWNQFRNLDLKRLKKIMKNPVFLDFRNIYEPAKMREMGFKYFAVGR